MNKCAKRKSGDRDSEFLWRMSKTETIYSIEKVIILYIKGDFSGCQLWSSDIETSQVIYLPYRKNLKKDQNLERSVIA